jgi:hypothetical protein
MLMHRSPRRRTSVQVFRRAHTRICFTLTPLTPFLSAERKTSVPFPYHFALGLESRASENLIYLLTLAVASSFSDVVIVRVLDSSFNILPSVDVHFTIWLKV